MFALPSMAGCLASSAAACACSCCSFATKEALKSSARAAWSILFTFSLLFSWLLRDFAKPLITKIPWIVKQLAGKTPPDEWFGQQAVYRLSMGNFMLFSALAIVMSFPAPVKFTSDWRDARLHHGSWVIKAALWLGCAIVPFFFSNGLVGAYAWLARAASPLFLGLQMMIIIDMANSWNEEWVAQGESEPRYLYALLAATVAAYGASFTAAGVAYYWFAPSSVDADCSLNFSLITFGIILIVVITAVTLHPRVKEVNPGASVFVAGCTVLYCSYLGFAALQSEPRDYPCNSLGQRLSAASGTTLAAGMAITLVSTVWAAFRAGSNTRTFTTGDSAADYAAPLLRDEEMTSAGLDGVPPTAPGGMDRGGPATAATAGGASAIAEFVPVSYSYPQFYGVFALASLYLSMLMTGWGAGTEAMDQIDVGWPSVWVKTVSQWACAALYCWTLVAPALFPDRTFS